MVHPSIPKEQAQAFFEHLRKHGAKDWGTCATCESKGSIYNPLYEIDYLDYCDKCRTEAKSKQLIEERGDKHYGFCDRCSAPASVQNALTDLIVERLKAIDHGFYCYPCLVPATKDAERKLAELYAPPKSPTIDMNAVKADALALAKKMLPDELFDFKDLNNPNNLCYQCHRELPADFHLKPWNPWAALPNNPRFDTQRCRDAAMRRHTSDADSEYSAEMNANANLREEYKRFVQRYNDTKAASEQPITALTFDDIPDEKRYSGNWIVAPQGSGKTVLLSQMFLRDAQLNASIIVMDSKGDLLAPIKELSSIKDRLILIEPDADKPLALNPFDIPRATPQHTAALLEYMISGLLGAKFTDLQLALFRNIIPIITKAIPNPTIPVFKDFLINGFENYQDHFHKLRPDQQKFMTDSDNGFLSKTYSGTRDQVVWRIDFLTSNDIVRTMFQSPKTRFDIGQLMDEGKIILIDNSKNLLTKDGCEFIGRFFVYLVLAAAMQRAGRPRDQKLPCFFYIDECHDVIRRDEHTADIIDQCRSQNIGMVLAHQRIKQIESPNVLDALKNCGVRLANSDDDAKPLADNLRTQPEFLQSLPVGTFAAFVRGVTKTAASLSVPFVDLNLLLKMSAKELAAIRSAMHHNYGFIPETEPSHSPTPTVQLPPSPSQPPTPTAQSPASPHQPPPDWSTKW